MFEMERQILKTTDMDIRPHLANMAEDLYCPQLAWDIRTVSDINLDAVITTLEIRSATC